MRKKLVMTVYDKDGDVQFSLDPASGDAVMSALTLFTEVGTEICLAIRDFENDVNDPNT